MPELDFMMIADYARAENGTATVVGAGIDRAYAPSLPALHMIGVAARVTFTPSESNREHNVAIQIRFGSQIIGEGGGSVYVSYSTDTDLPPGWPAGLVLGQTIPIPLTEYGVYHVDLKINGGVMKTCSFIVVDTPPTSPAQG